MAKAKRYCGMCDEWVSGKECPKCGAATDAAQKPVDMMEALRVSLRNAERADQTRALIARLRKSANAVANLPEHYDHFIGDAASDMTDAADILEEGLK